MKELNKLPKGMQPDDKAIILIVIVLLLSNLGFYSWMKYDKFLFLEIWTTYDGKVIRGNSSAIGGMCIDFPMYHFNESSKELHAGAGFKSQITSAEVVLGDGISLSGAIGSGAVSNLTLYNQLPAHFVRTVSNGMLKYNYTIDIKYNFDILINGSIKLSNGNSYFYFMNQTRQVIDNNGEPATILEMVKIRISNFGLCMKDQVR